MICPECHNENRDGARFCDACGFPLHDLPTVEAAPSETDFGQERLSDDAPLPLTNDQVDAVREEGLEGASSIVEEDAEAQKTLQIPSILQDLPSIGGEGDDEDAAAIEADMASGIEDAADDASSFDDNQDTLGPDATGVIGERLVDADYKAPKPDWRDGATMQMPVIETDDSPQSRDFRASATKEKKGSGRIIAIVVIIVALVAAAVAAGVTYSMELWGGKTVPDVSGLSQAEATSILEEHGFTVRATQVKSDDTEGIVLVEDPEASSRQPEGSEIVIHITVHRSMPDIVGKTEAQAKELLEAESLDKVTYTYENSDEEEGTVISVLPEAGTRVKGSTAVEVKIAQPYTVPDTSNMTMYEAIEAITNAGLQYQVYYTYSESYNDGTVLGTQPAANEKVKSDTVVTLNVTRVRSAELIAATQNYLVAGSTVQIGSYNYTISSLDSVQYAGNNQTTFSMVATPSFGFLVGSPMTVTGTISWNEDNSIASIATN